MTVTHVSNANDLFITIGLVVTVSNEDSLAISGGVNVTVTVDSDDPGVLTIAISLTLGVMGISMSFGVMGNGINIAISIGMKVDTNVVS